MAHSPMAGGVTVWSGSTVVMTRNRTRAKPDTTVSNAGAGEAPGAKAFERTHSSGAGAMLALRVWYEGLFVTLSQCGFQTTRNHLSKDGSFSNIPRFTTQRNTTCLASIGPCGFLQKEWEQTRHRAEPPSMALT